MSRRWVIARTALVFLVFHGPLGEAVASDTKADTPKRVAAALKEGLSSGRDVGLAFERAAALKGKFPDKEMQPVVKALGRAFKQDKKGLQILALKTLGDLDVDNSYAQFSKFLKLPKRVVGTETRAVRLKAIATAGVLHEEAALRDLEKLLDHPDVSFARGAVWALAGYSGLEKKQKTKLLKKLLRYYKAVEQQGKSRKAEVAKRATTLAPHVNTTLEKLTGKTGPTTAVGWEELLAKENAAKKKSTT